MDKEEILSCGCCGNTLTEEQTVLYLHLKGLPCGIGYNCISDVGVCIFCHEVVCGGCIIGLGQGCFSCCKNECLDGILKLRSDNDPGSRFWKNFVDDIRKNGNRVPNAENYVTKLSEKISIRNSTGRVTDS